MFLYGCKIKYSVLSEIDSLIDGILGIATIVRLMCGHKLLSFPIS